MTNANETTRTITVTWDEDKKTGKGQLVARDGDDTTTIDYDGAPIDAGTDSGAIADIVTGAMGITNEIAVDHDGPFVHITLL